MNLKTVASVALLLVQLVVVANACGPGRGGGRRRPNRRQVPLVQRQYVPNVGEYIASGRIERPIKKDDRRFRELVRNDNLDIVFDGGLDVRTKDNVRMMTQRLKEKLSTLAISVMLQWPQNDTFGMRLRVIEGWDDTGKHKEGSLHYEGRAVDITTSDKDSSKYGMLARLAVESGFDWVHYESRTHIHCSVRSERPDSLRNNGCFHGSSVLQTPTGTKLMSELKENDLVLTMNSNTGQLRYSPVLLWLDVDESVEEVFVEIQTKSNLTLKLTSAHLIYVVDELPKTMIQAQKTVKSASRLQFTNGINKRQRDNNGDDERRSKQRMFFGGLVYTTYARNLVAGQYLLVNPNNNINNKQSNNYESQLNKQQLENNQIVQPKDLQQQQQQISIYNSSTISNDNDDIIDNLEALNSINHKHHQDELEFIKLDEIVKVSYSVQKGVYAPLTREGNIVVDSVVASCYAVISDHDLAHMSFAPIRWYSYIYDSLFGNLNKLTALINTNSKLGFHLMSRRQSQAHIDEETKVYIRKTHWYPTLLHKIGKLLLPSNYLN